MTTDTGAQAGVRDDVEARAREAIAEYLNPDYWGEHVKPGYQHYYWVLKERQRSVEGAQTVIDMFTDAGIRCVDAAEDDRRTEALREFREFVAVFDGMVFSVGAGADERFRYRRARDKREALAPYLHADDTGGEGPAGLGSLCEERGADLQFCEAEIARLTADRDALAADLAVLLRFHAAAERFHAIELPVNLSIHPEIRDELAAMVAQLQDARTAAAAVVERREEASRGITS